MTHQPSNTRSLSKSTFKLGLGCETKLHYKRHRYPSMATDDPYLEFLADGGFMVEAIARAHFPDGLTVTSSANEDEFEVTARLLKGMKRGCIFEASFRHDGLSARVDILKVDGKSIRLIEVKASSFNSEEDGPNPFRGRRDGIAAKWRPYLEDVAFQVHVVASSLGPGYEVRPELCLVDKAKTCSEDMIFRHIELIPASERSFGKPAAVFKGDHKAVINDSLVAFVDASAEVEELRSEVEQGAQAMCAAYLDENAARPAPTLGRHCRDCEYRGAAAPGEADGFRECWGPLADARHHVLDLYRLDLYDRPESGRLAGLIADHICEISDIPESTVRAESATGKRQLVQIRCTRSQTEHVDPEMAAALDHGRLPLHFVDFETSRLAVPYHAGMQPYEQIAFQFSCHTMHSISAPPRHSEWINLEDAYPNFQFAKQLRRAIGDDGCMLVWSPHERSALQDIQRQMVRYGKEDRDLHAWIESLVRPADEGGRLLDLHDVCRSHYFHPSMRGSTSIKKVLPAVWSGNAELRAHPWFREYLRDGPDGPLSPYDALDGTLLASTAVDAVRDGTGAMRAYQDMLYGFRRNDQEYRDIQRKLLLQYCKLDTAAMIMIWMHWMSRLGRISLGGGNP